MKKTWLAVYRRVPKGMIFTTTTKEKTLEDVVQGILDICPPGAVIHSIIQLPDDVTVETPLS